MVQKDLKILVVDDERTIVELTTTILSHEGFSVIGTTDPEEALRWIEREPSIEVLILDVMMGKTTGPEIIRRAQRDRERKFRVLFMTGGFDGVRFRQTDRILQKPWSGAELVGELRRVLSDVPQHAAWNGPERRSSAA